MMQQLHGAPPTFWRRYSLSNRCQPLSIARKERYHRCDVARLVTQAGEVDAVAVDADAVAVVEAVAADALPLPAALAQALPQTFPTMTSARKACRRRRVRVDGAVGSCGTQVSAGQTLQVLSEQSAAAAAAKERPPRRRLVPAGLDVPVVYEDGSVAVVVKPWGLKCHGRGGRGGGGGHHLAAYLPLVLSPAQPGDDGGAAAGGPDRGDFAPNPAHRLDRLTGGLLAVAKTREAAAALTRQFESRGVGKRYRAVVAGRLEAPAGGSAGTAAAVVVAARLEGREALTEVTVVGHSRCLRYGGWVTTVDLAPKTGRRHQLRRHLALCLGHPILGGEARRPLLLLLLCCVGGGGGRREQSKDGSLHCTRKENTIYLNARLLPPIKLAFKISDDAQTHSTRLGPALDARPTASTRCWRQRPTNSALGRPRPRGGRRGDPVKWMLESRAGRETAAATATRTKTKMTIWISHQQRQQQQQRRPQRHRRRWHRPRRRPERSSCCGAGAWRCLRRPSSLTTP